MSHRLIAHSPDLLAMRNDGFNLEIRNGYLLVKDVPYVTASAKVLGDGVLIAKLDTHVVDGHERTRKPEGHVAYWTGALTFVDYFGIENRKAFRFEQLNVEAIRFVEEVERVSGRPVSLLSTDFNWRNVVDRRAW